MIDTLKPITRNYKVACGWDFLIHFIQEISDTFIIHGFVFDGYDTKIPMTWDCNGYPVDMEKYPTNYYLRLIKQ
jgi:hypothetical protein